MASRRVTDHFGVLEYLKDLTKLEQKKFIETASCELLKTISEICLNLLKGSIKLPSEELAKLKKYKLQIVSLARKKHSIKKRKVICNQKGGFLGSLISACIPAIISGIVSATSRR